MPNLNNLKIFNYTTYIINYKQKKKFNNHLQKRVFIKYRIKNQWQI